MKRQPIAEAVISSRNILLGGRTNENVILCLEDGLTELDSIAVPSTREIFRFCLTEAIRQIKNNEFISAGKILNLIHNLPQDEEGELQWNLDYFLSMELPAFLDSFEEVISARMVALCVLKQIGDRYSSDALTG